MLFPPPLFIKGLGRHVDTVDGQDSLIDVGGSDVQGQRAITLDNRVLSDVDALLSDVGLQVAQVIAERGFGMPGQALGTYSVSLFQIVVEQAVVFTMQALIELSLGFHCGQAMWIAGVLG